MDFCIQHEIHGRIRLRLNCGPISNRIADTLEYYMLSQKEVISVKVYERTGGVAVIYKAGRESILNSITEFCYDSFEVPKNILENTGRALNDEYKGKLVRKVMTRIVMQLFAPRILGLAYITVMASKFIVQGIKSLTGGELTVAVLDATAIGTSIFRRDFGTAGSIMFLLSVGELLEEWTHKKSIGDLARSMYLNVGRVWVIRGGERILLEASQIVVDDLVVVQMGNQIPFDGVVEEGEAMINPVSLTGESKPIHKCQDSYVYAGTVVEEGEIVIRVTELCGTTRYDRIVKMIEESEQLKSKVENKSETLANGLVFYTFMGTGLVWALTRNFSKALTVLLVDFSCALKLSIPISVLSAIREARQNKITIKGGKYLETMAGADTIVFDKTGTLTIASPVVTGIVNFGPGDVDEKLRIAACLEEHFPHSMARAVVQKAIDRKLDHEEMHSKVEYIVAHGVVSKVDGKRVLIGSEHFVFHDEGCTIHSGYEQQFEELPIESSHLFFAVDGKLEAVILLEDPEREDAGEVVQRLKELGLSNTVMMTGDNHRIASSIAKKVGIDRFYAQVLPDNKADYINEVKREGSTVIMVGDGVNDAPALSAADVGIAMGGGAELAREISDVTIMQDDLSLLIKYRELSEGLMKRIDYSYKGIVGINLALIMLGIGGYITPATSALLHNVTTIGIAMHNMQNILVSEN